MNPYKDSEESSFSSSSCLAYESIATQLLKDNFFLTALEFHTELVENGKELPQLREFFSNPGNFEQHVTRATDFTSMHRTPSQATLDSLDTARYSEDGGGDRVGSNDIAVLEFELRKARETINSLRANLTQFADADTAIDKNKKENFNQRSLKPHEKRALNFLINEYLLLQNYKLTSITFSDENPDQEFEDWDDVGLNMPRPANLISLFWGSTDMNIPKVDASTGTDEIKVDMECQTDLDESSPFVSCQALDSDAEWNHEILIQAEEIELLKQKVVALENEKLDFQKLYDAAILSLNSLTSPSSESKGLDLQIPSDKILNAQSKEQSVEIKPLTCTASENHYGSGNSTHSATPEQFEIIYTDKNGSGVVKKEGSNTSSFEPGLVTDSVRGSPLRRGSVITLDETLSSNDAGEWTRVQYDYTIENNKEMWIDSAIPNSLKESILSWCSETLDVNEPLSNDLLSDLVTYEKPITLPGLLPLVADTLPRVLPHTLVARRSEAAALLSAAAALLPPGDTRRSTLLNSLFTLYKKPDPPDARAICEATCLIVKWGASREALSSIAEQLQSRSHDRRILASQICLFVAPYVPVEHCTSLLLDIVTTMSDSNEAEIRAAGLKLACFICPVADNKYDDLQELMFKFLKDPVDKNVKDTVFVFAPILARTALMDRNFFMGLYYRIIKNIQRACSDNESKTVVLYLDVMGALVLAQLAYVMNVQIVRVATQVKNNCDMETINLQDMPYNEKFVDLQCYIITDKSLTAELLFKAMYRVLKCTPSVRWAELEWFIEIVNQILDIAKNIKALNHHVIYESLITLFNNYVETFGVEFSNKVLRPIFTDMITKLENKLEKLHAVNVDSAVIVGIYSVSILIAVEGNEQRAEFLQKWVLYSSIRGLPVKIFSIPFKWLAEHKVDILRLYLQQLREFAASSCDSASGSTIRVYIATLIFELLNSTDVDEESIEKQLLPTVIALLFDSDVVVREMAITAWGSITRTCIARGLLCEEQCWPPFENIVNSGAMSGREGARAAEALALLVLPSIDSHAVSERAVSLLCALCGTSAGTAGECVCALTPALQLATHHCAHHPALLAALRKLEETVQSPALSQYKPAIEALLHEVGSGDAPRGPSPRPTTNLQAAQEVGRRVTQMFQQSKSNMNLQSIFKKKT